MNTRCFPAAVIATATLAIWVRFTVPVAAQELSPPSTAPSTPAAAVAPVRLTSGAEDILKLSRAKLNDDVTVAFVQTSDRHYNLTASDIVYLRKEGVSDRVLTAMLSQPSPAAASPPPAPAPAPAPEASAPQYTTQPTISVLETAPASTVYLATTPSYYSFSDPWPYWSSWYAYPYLSFGFSWGWGNWGNCNYGYWNNGCWNNGYSRNGYYPPRNGNPTVVNGNRPPPPNGNPTAPRGSAGTSSRSERLVSEGRQPSNVNQASSRTGFNRVEGRSASTTTARPTSVWSNNGNQPAAARASGSQASVAATRSGQAVAPASLSGNGANNRVATRTVENRGAAQFTGSSRSSSPTTVWSGSASQRPTASATVNQNASSVARPSRVSAGPAAIGNRPGNQPATRYMPSQAPSYQRGGSSPGNSYRASGSFSGASRPSMSPSTGGMGNTSAFRDGGSFSGGGAPRMSSGGGSRGGGGGGGGGGRHR